MGATGKTPCGTHCRRTCGIQRISDALRSRIGSAAEKTKAGASAGSNGRTFVGRSCGDARFASRHGEVASICGQEETSGEIAMLCDKYKEALIEAVASGAAPPAAAREHVDRCAQCRATLAAQQALFTMVDAGLRSRTNAAVPSNFEHRVRAALQIQVARRRRSYFSVLGFGSMAATAALALTISLTHNANNGRKGMRPGSASQTEPSVSRPAASSGESKEVRAFSHPGLHSRSRALNIAGRPNVQALWNNGVEVLVPPGQEELLVKYMEEVGALRARATFSASLQHEADMKPMEVSSIEISELVVKPLPDLSSN